MKTKTYYLRGLLQSTGWLENVRVTVDTKGKITEIVHAVQAEEGDIVFSGFGLPGFQNAHSHAFQYAMAGLAESHEGSKNPDDFWGWREAMYKLALGMNPEQMEAIATMLYSEMARHGYTNVAEFHYVHHAKNGKEYDSLAEMGKRLIAAAQTAGIGITLIPIFYQKGSFGQEPTDKQRRFISSNVDEYLKLFDASAAACAFYDEANVAVGIHSMRGVEPTDIALVASTFQQDLPFHIHVSEQLKEIEDSVAYLGKRPVEWLLENMEVTERFHLVHATHLSEAETAGIASSKANVVLCPSTEGNLGDGIFPLRDYQEAGGKWSIGTDSHVGINPLEELRILDYGQRLISHKRNTFFSSKQRDSGMFALEMATLSGRKAMNNQSADFFAEGQSFNASILDASSPLLASSSLENLTSTIVYSSDASMQLATISHGDVVVKNYEHIYGEEIRTKFVEVISKLKNR
ncbi:MAG: formimidoylglutamate deiminase [Cyclobacteriaceae bacterium]